MSFVTEVKTKPPNPLGGLHHNCLQLYSCMVPNHMKTVVVYVREYTRTYMEMSACMCIA